MGYLADFVTGRSIGGDDRAVAVVIVPARHGHPNPVTGAAKCPVYPADRFEPLSLPMHGGLDDYGYFLPDSDDLGLRILLDAIKAPDWATVSEAINAMSAAHEFPDPSIFDKNRVTAIHPGIAVMHASTFASLVRSAERQGSEDEPRQAAAIVLDAKNRWARDRDDAFYSAATMQLPRGHEYTTLDGRTFDVPHLCQVLSESDGPHVTSEWLRDAIRRRHENDHGTDGSSLLATFSLLHDFHRAATGLHYMHKYWQPSGFARSENIVTVARLQADDLLASFDGIADRLGLEPGDEAPAGLLAVAERLRAALDKVEAELARTETPDMGP